MIDESTNIASHRIINTSIVTNNSNCFYISNIEADLSKLGAKELAIGAVEIAKN